MSYGAGCDKNEGENSGEAAETAKSRLGGSGAIGSRRRHRPVRQQPTLAPCTFAQAFDARRIATGDGQLTPEIRPAGQRTSLCRAGREEMWTPLQEQDGKNDKYTDPEQDHGPEGHLRR